MIGWDARPCRRCSTAIGTRARAGRKCSEEFKLRTGIRERWSSGCARYHLATKAGRRRSSASRSPEYLATAAAPERPLAQRRVSAALLRCGGAGGASGVARASCCRNPGAGSRNPGRSKGASDPLDAARCALALGWILRDRGRNAEAEKQFEHARTLMPDSLEGIQASIAIGIVWTDDDRLIDAEALLRSVHSAAALLEDRETERAAALALGRCLLWRGRIDEAGAVVTPHTLERCSGVRMGARSAHPPGGRRGGAAPATPHPGRSSARQCRDHGVTLPSLRER